MDDNLLTRFAAIVGDRYAIRTPDDISPFVHEERGLWPGLSPLVLRPGSVDEVSAIMKLATETRTAIVPQGGNTGLVGAQMPDRSGRQVVLSLSRLNRIREVDVHSNTIIAEAGVILANLHKAADDVDRLYPLALASRGPARSAATCRQMPEVSAHCPMGSRATCVLVWRSFFQQARCLTTCES